MRSRTLKFVLSHASSFHPPHFFVEEIIFNKIIKFSICFYCQTDLAPREMKITFAPARSHIENWFNHKERRSINDNSGCFFFFFFFLTWKRYVYVRLPHYDKQLWIRAVLGHSGNRFPSILTSIGEKLAPFVDSFCLNFALKTRRHAIDKIKAISLDHCNCFASKSNLFCNFCWQVLSRAKSSKRAWKLNFIFNFNSYFMDSIENKKDVPWF